MLVMEYNSPSPNRRRDQVNDQVLRWAEQLPSRARKIRRLHPRPQIHAPNLSLQIPAELPSGPGAFSLQASPSGIEYQPDGTGHQTPEKEDRGRLNRQDEGKDNTSKTNP